MDIRRLKNIIEDRVQLSYTSFRSNYISEKENFIRNLQIYILIIEIIKERDKVINFFYINVQA